jgi:hypothetical protein
MLQYREIRHVAMYDSRFAPCDAVADGRLARHQRAFSQLAGGDGVARVPGLAVFHAG